MTQVTNTAEKAFQNQRDAMLSLMDVATDSNVYTYALRLMYALKHRFVTSSQYEMLCSDLQAYCKENNLSTSGQGVSLF
jgi:hypothetical protein